MRRVEENVIERFLACSDPQQGFARIYCDHCRHGFILAFSCKARYFCPSCHQKRVLAYGDWVEANVLAQVPHRQYVFTIPRLLRPMSARRRALLGKLCNIIERLLDRAYASTRAGARPGIILFVQTFGDLVNIARGPIVDAQALIAALRERRIAGAGLDVYWDEPRVQAELAAMEQVVLAPHIGSTTREVREERGRKLLANLRAHFAGRSPPNPLTRDR